MSNNLVFLGLHLAISKRECSPRLRKRGQHDIPPSFSVRELDHGKVRVLSLDRPQASTLDNCHADLRVAGPSLNARRSLSNRLESLSGNSDGVPMPVVFPTVHYSPRSPTAPWSVSSGPPHLKQHSH